MTNQIFVTRAIRDAVKLCLAIVLLTMTGAVALGQTTNYSISVGGGTFTYTVVESTSTCPVGSPSGAQQTIYQFSYNTFAFTATGVNESWPSQSVGYLVSPGGSYCPTTGWTGTVPVSLTWASNTLLFTPATPSSTGPGGPGSATLNKPTPTITASCSPSSIVAGSQSTTCTAKVSNGATGTVAWTINGSAWTNTNLSSGTTSAISNFAGYASGTDTISANYQGDINNNAVSATTSLTLTSKTTPTISVACSPSTLTNGQSTTCTASVSNNATGTITWTINGVAWTSSTLSGGKASATGTIASAAGSYTILAAYSGDSNNNAVSSSTAVTVSTGTTYSISVSGDGTFAYTVVQSGAACGSTGQYSYTEFTYINLSYTAPGISQSWSNGGTAYIITPGYQGCPPTTGWQGPIPIVLTWSSYTLRFTPATPSSNGPGGPGTASVNLPTPSISASCSPSTIIPGVGSATCTATLGNNATGEVTWTDNGNFYETTGLTNAKTTLTSNFSSYATGAYTIGANYSGDLNNTPASASTNLALVAMGTPSVAVSCSPNPVSDGNADDKLHC